MKLFGLSGLAILLVTVGRALAIYPLSLLFARSTMRVKGPDQHILFWCGLRGALALALVLGFPREMAGRAAILAVAFAVVAFSNFVQGLTITPLIGDLENYPLRHRQNRMLT